MKESSSRRTSVSRVHTWEIFVLIPFIAFYIAATKKYFEKAVTDYDPDDDSKVDSDSTEWW